MKEFIILIFLIVIADAYGACSSPIARTNFNQGDVVSSLKINADFDDLYSHLNDLNGDCIESFSTPTESLDSESVTSDKVADGSVTFEKFAAGVIPTLSPLTRVRVFTANGKYVKPPNVEKIFVQVIGGGGGTIASATSPIVPGGASSFGSHCWAGGGGGTRSNSSIYGAGGGASGGDINLSGINGISSGGAIKGLLGEYGMGGEQNTSTASRNPGGAGGYCAKLIDKSALGDNTDVVIGIGGQISDSFGPQNGKNGIVVIQEFTR